MEVLVAVAVRPMLLRGLHLSDPDMIAQMGAESLTPHQLACQELGGAMMMLLPGLDANDQAKTERTIGFYLTMFSNCVAFTGLDLQAEGDEAVVELPIYISDFVTQLVRQLFSVIDALKGYAGGGVDNSNKYALTYGTHKVIMQAEARYVTWTVFKASILTNYIADVPFL